VRSVKNSDDFLDNKAEPGHLDFMSMRLIATGEGLKIMTGPFNR